MFKIEDSIDADQDTNTNKIKFGEIRDDDKGFTLWFDPLINYTTYKIYQDFGAQDLTWNLQSKLWKSNSFLTLIFSTSIFVTNFTIFI